MPRPPPFANNTLSHRRRNLEREVRVYLSFFASQAPARGFRLGPAHRHFLQAVAGSRSATTRLSAVMQTSFLAEESQPLRYMKTCFEARCAQNKAEMANSFGDDKPPALSLGLLAAVQLVYIDLPACLGPVKVCPIRPGSLGVEYDVLVAHLAWLARARMARGQRFRFICEESDARGGGVSYSREHLASLGLDARLSCTEVHPTASACAMVAGAELKALLADAAQAPFDVVVANSRFARMPSSAVVQWPSNMTLAEDDLCGCADGALLCMAVQKLAGVASACAQVFCSMVTPEPLPALFASRLEQLGQPGDSAELEVALTREVLLQLPEDCVRDCSILRQFVRQPTRAAAEFARTVACTSNELASEIEGRLAGNGECAICFEPLRNRTLFLGFCCGLLIDFSCLKSWLGSSQELVRCPTCSERLLAVEFRLVSAGVEAFGGGGVLASLLAELDKEKGVVALVAPPVLHADFAQAAGSSVVAPVRLASGDTEVYVVTSARDQLRRLPPSVEVVYFAAQADEYDGAVFALSSMAHARNKGFVIKSRCALNEQV